MAHGSVTLSLISRRGDDSAIQFALAAVLLPCGLFPATSSAGDVAVSVLDVAGHGVAEVVVTLAPADGRTLPSTRLPGPAVMDQNHRAFVPQVLVVPVGSPVSFPNNDTISHQVYSFSAAKRFQLPLYKGQAHPPVNFDREGLVVLGCNIHDEMAGYIYVTAAPRFGTTKAEGQIDFKGLPAGDYRVTAWGPLVADPAATLTRTVHVEASGTMKASLQLARPLRGRPEPRPRRNDWEY
jgi:plastocyanin